MCLDGPLRFRLAVAGEDLPVVRLSWRAGRAGYRVDVTSYLFLPVRCVIDQVRLAGQIG